jgi:hypothetical protein
VPPWRVRGSARNRCGGKDPFDFVFDLLIEGGCVYFIIDEADLALAMKHTNARPGKVLRRPNARASDSRSTQS